MVDVNFKRVPYYDPVPGIFEKIANLKQTKIAVASNNAFTNETHDLIRLFGWHKYINFEEVFLGDKILHFERSVRENLSANDDRVIDRTLTEWLRFFFPYRLRHRAKTPFFDMLYFDDNSTSVLQISDLGVCGITIGTHGMEDYYLDYGLKIFANRKANDTDHISCRSISLILGRGPKTAK